MIDAILFIAAVFLALGCGLAYFDEHEKRNSKILYAAVCVTVTIAILWRVIEWLT